MPNRQKKLKYNGVLHFALYILKFIFLSILITQKSVSTENNIMSISRRARCAVDCYAKCAKDGIVCFYNLINLIKFFI